MGAVLLMNSLPDCVLSGAVQLWLEQEGEAQLCPKRRGLHSQVQPGEIRIRSCSISQSEEAVCRDL